MNGVMMDQTSTPLPAAGGVFPATRWSRVSRLRHDPSSSDGQHALAEICEVCWFPLYAFARRKGQSREDAQDITQNFFARMLDGGFFSRARAAEGKMRTYLLTVFTRHMADEWDKANARKRGGGIEKLSLDFDEGERRYLLEPAASETHDLAFERAWAAQIIDSAGGQAGAGVCADWQRRAFRTDRSADHRWWRVGVL
jgi:RNA polymerase sigma-70 factor (ECF subfamily)